MIGAPYFYDYRNVINSMVFPATERISNSKVAMCFKRYLLQKAISVFKWDLPENWVPEYFLYLLYEVGYVGVLNTDKFGVIPQFATLQGYGVQYQPVRLLIANPLLKTSFDLQIGKTCEVIKLQPDWGGIRDLLDMYGDMMALSLEALGVNIANSRLAYLFFADNKADAESWKGALDDILSGKLGVVLDKGLKRKPTDTNDYQPFISNVTNNFIAPEIMEVWNELEDRFDHDIGIPTANTDKKERVGQAEVTMGNRKTYYRSDMWLDTLKSCCKKVNNLFNINISVDWRFNPDEVGGVTNGITESNVDNSSQLQSR